jgi:hypothetical protein
LLTVLSLLRAGSLHHKNLETLGIRCQNSP